MEICGKKITRGREAEINKTTCEGCPCVLSDLSDQISNYGCLPEWYNLVEYYLQGQGIWKCHDKNRPCGGLVQVLKQNEIPLDKNNELLITADNPWIDPNQKWGVEDK